MKRTLFLKICLFLGGSYGLWKATGFRENQEDLFQTTKNTYMAVIKEYSQCNEDLKFLMSHQDTLAFLQQKGWFFPCSRLLAGSYLEALGFQFEDFSYQFNPQQSTSIGDIYFKTTAVRIDLKSFLDVGVYSALENILKKFPGILRIQEISLIRSQGDPHSIIGHLIFDWVAIDEASLTLSLK